MPMHLRHAYLHGFASSSQSAKGQALRRFYADQGVELRTPDLNAPSFAELSYTGMLAAVDALDRELDAREQVEPGTARWRFVGSSMGGYLAARWAELHPERVDRLLLLCPAFDFGARWPELLGAAAFARWRETGRMALPDATGQPVEVHFGLVEDAARHPARPIAPCPVKIVHGRGDTTVPLASSQRYVEALTARGVPIELIEVDDDHLLRESMPTLEAIARDWLLDPRRVLFWDFFGPPSAGTAEHFHRHLDEFLAREQIAGCATGFEVSAPGRHAVTWCRCPEADLEAIGRALRPHRFE